MSRPRRDVDGGWAWMVLVASFMNLLLASGIGFVSGIFQKLFLEQFGQSVAYTAWVTALFSSFMQLGGPMSGWLTSLTNCRLTVMVGGALLSGGLVASSFATSLRFLLVSFGLVAGLGLGLMYTASIVIVNFFFDRRRTVIMGVALSASGIGITFTPVLSRILIDQFSWQETMMILAAMAAHVCVFGAVMFPVHEPPSLCLQLCHKSQQCRDLKPDACAAGNATVDYQAVLSTPLTPSSKHDSGTKSSFGDVVGEKSGVKTVEGEEDQPKVVAGGPAERVQLLPGTDGVTNTGKEIRNQEPLLKTNATEYPQHVELTLQPPHAVGPSRSLNDISLPQNGADCSPYPQRRGRKMSHSAHHLDKIPRPTAHRLWAHSWLSVDQRGTPRGSQHNVTIFTSFHSLYSGGLPAVLPHLTPSPDPDHRAADSAQDRGGENGGDGVGDGDGGGGGGDWVVFRNVPFLFLCLHLFLSNMACGVFNIHLAAFSQERGLTDQDITLVYAIDGLAVFVFRILLGALGHDVRVDKLAVYFGVHLVASFVQAALPWTQNLGGVTALTFLMGTYYGSAYTLLSSLTIDIVGLRSLAFAFGVEMIAAGLGYLVAPPIAGWIVDVTGDYDNSMYFGGFLMLLSALCLLCLTCGRPPGSPPIGYLPLPLDTQATVELNPEEGDTRHALDQSDREMTGRRHTTRAGSKR